jgi:hypothetical protein
MPRGELIRRITMTQQYNGPADPNPNYQVPQPRLVESAWIRLLRTFAWAAFVIGAGAGVFVFVEQFRGGDPWRGAAVLAVAVVAGLLALAIVNVLLSLVANLDALARGGPRGR